MSAIGDFFNSLFSKFIDVIMSIATDLFTTSAKIIVAEMEEGFPMAVRWAREAVEAAEATGGSGDDKWNAAYAAFTSKATTEGYDWSKRAVETLLQNTVNVVKTEVMEALNPPAEPKVE